MRSRGFQKQFVHSSIDFLIIISSQGIMDNLHYRLIFHLGKEREIREKNLLKVVKFQNLAAKNVVKYGKYSLAKFANFLYFCITYGSCCHAFLSRKW